MTCPVLGGGGFLGINLCSRLAALGANVKVFGRPPKIFGGLTTTAYVVGEFTDNTSVAQAVEGADIVFNLIGATTPASSNIDKVADLQMNVVNTLHLLNACLATNVKKVVFASSGGTIYGRPETTPTPETVR